MGTDYIKKQKSIKLDLKQASNKKNSGALVRKSSHSNKDTFRGIESQDPGEGQGSIGMGPMAANAGYADNVEDAQQDSIQISHPKNLM